MKAVDADRECRAGWSLQSYCRRVEAAFHGTSQRHEVTAVIIGHDRRVKLLADVASPSRRTVLRRTQPRVRLSVGDRKLQLLQRYTREASRREAAIALVRGPLRCPTVPE